MKPQKLYLALCFLAALSSLSAASALTLEDIKAKLKAAGYSQIQQQPSGEIKTFRATRDGMERTILVDSTGHIQELQ